VPLSGRPAATWRAWSADASKHPSPNAGQIEAAFAGTLNVQLGGVNAYDGVTEDRHTLGNGSAPLPSDIDRANRLSQLVGRATIVLAVLFSATSARPTPRQRPHR
jgi:adenosylcobinamide-phosphate synthase